MRVVYVGVGEFAASKNEKAALRTLALGSCVAVIVLAPSIRAVGLLHVALPDSSIDKHRASQKPGMFADTGIPLLLKELEKLGHDEKDKLVVKLAGGASIMDPNNTFNIGKRNLLAVRKILWRYRLGALAEEVGGNISRSVTVNIGTGRVYLSSPGKGEWQL